MLGQKTTQAFVDFISEILGPLITGIKSVLTFLNSSILVHILSHELQVIQTVFSTFKIAVFKDSLDSESHFLSRRRERRRQRWRARRQRLMQV